MEKLLEKLGMDLGTLALLDSEDVESALMSAGLPHDCPEICSVMNHSRQSEAGLRAIKIEVIRRFSVEEALVDEFISKNPPFTFASMREFYSAFWREHVNVSALQKVTSIEKKFRQAHPFNASLVRWYAETLLQVEGIPDGISLKAKEVLQHFQNGDSLTGVSTRTEYDLGYAAYGDLHKNVQEYISSGKE